MLIEIIITVSLLIGIVLFILLGHFYFLQLLFLLLLLAGYSYFIERNSLEITYPEIKINCLSKDIKEKIVLISDLHFNAKTSKATINKLLEAVGKSNPEVVFITGDLIDRRNGTEIAGKFVSEISKFAKVYIVFGNWDYFVLNYNINDLKRKLEANGAVVLINESKIVKIGDNSFDLIGIKDPFTSKDTKNDLKKAISNTTDNNFCKILLTHSPEAIKDASLNNIDLVLAGHTHGGQVYVPVITRMIIPVRFGYKKYIKGIYKVGDSTLYVNRGIGTSNLPFRFLVPPELTVLSLTKGK